MVPQTAICEITSGLVFDLNNRLKRKYFIDFQIICLKFKRKIVLGMINLVAIKTKFKKIHKEIRSTNDKRQIITKWQINTKTRTTKIASFCTPKIMEVMKVNETLFLLSLLHYFLFFSASFLIGNKEENFA